MTTKQVLKKIIDFCIFSIGILIIAVTLTCMFQLLKSTPNEFIRSILTVIFLITVKCMPDAIKWIITGVMIISITLTGCLLGLSTLQLAFNISFKLVLPFIICYGTLLLAVNLVYVANPSLWYKVHNDKKNGKTIVAMLPDIYRMVWGDNT